MSGLGLFVRAREQEERIWMEGGLEMVEEKTPGALSGEEARDFYQSLFQEEQVEEKEKEEKKERRRRRGQAEGEAPPAGVTENYRLMSAGYCGEAGVLLRRGARWRGYTHPQGRGLARLAGHHDIVAQLDGCDITDPAHTPPHSPEAPPPRWCQTCGVHYSEATPTHRSSTLHLFAGTSPPPAPRHCLSPCSAPYRMMLRLGWDPRSGLGPGHGGRLRPVGTVLRADRAGLGFGRGHRSKVTHFGANDVQAVRRRRRGGRGEREATPTSTKQRRKKRRRREEEEEKQWERDYRASFNLDS